MVLYLSFDYDSFKITLIAALFFSPIFATRRHDNSTLRDITRYVTLLAYHLVHFKNRQQNGNNNEAHDQGH